MVLLEKDPATARGIARKHAKASIKVLEEKAMRELGMGALLSVAAGSEQPAKLIVVEYRGGKRGAAELLAEKLDCPRGKVELLRGHTSRHKTVMLHGFKPEDIRPKLSSPWAMVLILLKNATATMASPMSARSLT